MTDITAVSRAGDARAQISYASNAAAQSAADHRFQNFLTSFKHADAPQAPKPPPPHPSAAAMQAEQGHVSPDGSEKGHCPVDRTVRAQAAPPVNKTPPAGSRGVAPPHVEKQAPVPRAVVEAKGSRPALRVPADDTPPVVGSSQAQPTVMSQMGARSSLSCMRSSESGMQDEPKEPSVGLGRPVSVPLPTAASSASTSEHEAESGPQRAEISVGKAAGPVDTEIRMDEPAREESAAKPAVSEPARMPEPPEEPVDVMPASDQASIETEKKSDGHQTTLTLDFQQLGKISFDIVNKDNKTFVFVPSQENIAHISPMIKEMLPDCEILQKPQPALTAKDKNTADHNGNTASGKQSFWARVVNISV